MRLCSRVPLRARTTPFTLSLSSQPVFSQTTLINTSRAMAYSISVDRPFLGAVPDSAKDKPHHVNDSHGKRSHFKNPHPSWKTGIPTWQFPYYMIKGRIDGTMRFPDPREEPVAIRTPEFLPTRLPAPDTPAGQQAQGRLRTTWLGHACHYVEFPSGLRVLFDPVLEDRCSPLTFAGPKRYTRRACPIADLPFLDAVVISHSHYDHLSLPTVREIQRCFPAAHFFVGLGLESWFRDSGVANVTEMDWWEDVDVTVRPGGEKEGEAGEVISATISCLPSQHTSSRYGLDHDKTLWCSWAVKSTSPPSPSSPEPVTKSVYFGGDTGYRSVPELPPSEDNFGAALAHLPSNPDFARVGELRGPFDVGLIPIGAYAPRNMMSPMHANPFDAVEIFRDTRCRRALGIHWGTWALTVEPVMEPPEKLREALRRRGLAEEGLFDICDIGETRTF